MKSASATTVFLWMAAATACAALSSVSVCSAEQASASPAAPASAHVGKTFDSAQRAADALVDAADKFDVGALLTIFGPGGENIVLTGDFAQDHQRAKEFSAQAHQKMSVSMDPKGASRAFILVGPKDWPFPVPIVNHGGKWSFDAKAGSQEIMYRRIGANELDAIDLLRGFAEAQHEYAMQKRDGYDVNQYAQRIISTPGKRDGLAWKNADGTWGGPVGETIAHAIEEGYSSGKPYHGYFFKVLKGQGPDAPLGAMDFVVKGVMIGGFALVATPAEYGATGLKSFIVSHTGVVYEKDLGSTSLEDFSNMQRYNPDKSWSPVSDDD